VIRCKKKYFVSGAWALIMLVPFWLVTACTTSGIAEKKTGAMTFEGRRILILPVKDMALIHGVNKSVTSPFSGKFYITGKVMGPADELLTDKLISFVESRPDYLSVQANPSQGQPTDWLTDGLGVASEKQILAQLGRNAKADAVLTGCVYRFEERVGTKHSVQSPASVIFEIHLINVKDGSIVWSGIFSETQQSLSENLLNIKTFIQRKARWITAREMAMSGLEDLLRTFPDYDHHTGY
jgi:hypothetical protein